jgi:hypothetical protein
MRVGPKSNDMCLYSKRNEYTQRFKIREESHANILAEIRVIQSQASERLDISETGKGKEGIFLKPCERCMALSIS